MTTNNIDWQRLKDTAVKAMKKAYCPYSNFPVGAAGLAEDGRIVSGCNVENAAFGVTLCAECGLVSDLINTGGGKLVAFYCVNANEIPEAPCGRCRQLLYEHGGDDLLLMTAEGIRTMTQMLPGAFGPNSLKEVTSSEAKGDHDGTD